VVPLLPVLLILSLKATDQSVYDRAVRRFKLDQRPCCTPAHRLVAILDLGD
jgi:hypothetical protein